MTMRDIVIAQIQHQETDFVPYQLTLYPEPCAILTQHYGSEDWNKNILSPFSDAPCFFDSWQVMRQIDPEDPRKTTDPFGCLWTMGEEVSHLDRCAIWNVDPRNYVWPTLSDFFWPERQQMLKTWDETHSRDHFSIVSIGAGYWEHMWRLLGAEDALLMCIDDPDTFDFLVDGLDKLINQFADAAVQTSADAIYIADDWCDQRGCMIGPDRWRKFLKPRLARLYQKAHDHGKYVINHVCGNVEPLMPDLIEIGLDVLESVQPEAMDPCDLKRRYGKHITFYGGVGCQYLLPFASPDEVRTEIRNLRREMSKGGGYILSSAKPLNKAVPPANVVAAYEAFTEENEKFLRQL